MGWLPGFLKVTDCVIASRTLAKQSPFVLEIASGWEKHQAFVMIKIIAVVKGL
jgi:hypothetical protein